MGAGLDLVLLGVRTVDSSSKKETSVGLSVVHASQQRWPMGLWHVQIGHSHNFLEVMVGGDELFLRDEEDDLVLGDCSNTKRLMGRVESGLMEVGLLTLVRLEGGDAVSTVGGAREEVRAKGVMSPPPFPVGFAADGGIYAPPYFSFSSS